MEPVTGSIPAEKAEGDLLKEIPSLNLASSGAGRDRGLRSTRIAAWLGLAFIALACAGATVLAMMSLLTTGFFEVVPERTTLLSTTERMTLHQGLPSLSFVLGFLILFALLLVVARTWLAHFPTVNLAHFIGLYTLTVAVLWLLSLNATGDMYVYADSSSLFDAANAIVLHRTQDFAPDLQGYPSLYDYFSWYPFQTGALLWFVLIFKLFGAGNIIAIQFVNAFLLSGIAWALQRIGIALGLNGRGQRLEALLLMTSVPFLMSPAFAYTNTAGMFFVVLALLAALRAAKAQRYPAAIGWTVACFAVGAFAVMIKGTVVIFLIAFALVLAVCALRNRLFWLIPLDFALLFAANKIAGLSVPVVEHLVGQRFGAGLPQLSWIAIGLTRASLETDMPGWWNATAVEAYKAAQGDPALQSETAKQTIVAALGYFLGHPAEAAQFFWQKLASEWSEPSYQTLYYSSLTERRANGTIASRVLYGWTNGLLLSFENVHQSVVYLFSAIGLGCAFRRARRRDAGDQESATMLFLAMIFLGGAGCFLLWEAKSVYVLPFAVMLIPVAAYGLQHVDEAMRHSGLAGRLSGAVAARRSH